MSGSALPKDQDLVRLAKLRREILAEPLASVESRKAARDYLMEALDRGSNLHYAYTFLQDKFPLECDIKCLLDAFARLDDGADVYRCAVPDLKLIRRRAFQRYAFELAGEVNRRLLQAGESRLWLVKDFCFLRIPLALPIGYAVVLGSSGIADWLWALRASLPFAVLLTAASLAVSGFLIYVDVREQIGRTSAAFLRAAIVLGAAVLYSLTFMAAGRLIGLLAPALAFSWGNAVLVTDAALAIAVIAQFFFAKSGSIADPL